MGLPFTINAYEGVDYFSYPVPSRLEVFPQNSKH